nr:chymotrypsin inhibitor WCI [Triticum aestivum]
MQTQAQLTSAVLHSTREEKTNQRPSMASCSQHLLSAVAIFSVLAAAATATSMYTCYEGVGLPVDPLQGCHYYVTSQTCGFVPLLPIEVMKDRCCRELAAISSNCRCEGLRVFIDRAFPPSQSQGGGPPQPPLAPRCPTEVKRDFARTLALPGQCNLPTIHGGPYCVFP